MFLLDMITFGYFNMKNKDSEEFQLEMRMNMEVGLRTLESAESRNKGLY